MVFRTIGGWWAFVLKNVSLIGSVSSFPAIAGTARSLSALAAGAHIQFIPHRPHNSGISATLFSRWAMTNDGANREVIGPAMYYVQLQPSIRSLAD